MFPLVPLLSDLVGSTEIKHVYKEKVKCITFI